PASVLLELLNTRNASISIAESCTGGWVQKFITDVSGASQCYLGGVVSYANSMKQETLKVPAAILELHGAVSTECAKAMAKGIKRLTESSFAISVTGIAGPEGGSSEKPVGTVFFGFETMDNSWTSKQIFNGERDSIRHKAAEFALLEMIKYLQGRNI
ncbi:MAG: CinA family protein, partial [Candidatus Cloacimonetes bacterium]|nr:CinA family protein [Candidatus Cloacimonadota bacterium]